MKTFSPQNDIERIGRQARVDTRVFRINEQRVRFECPRLSEPEERSSNILQVISRERARSVPCRPARVRTMAGTRLIAATLVIDVDVSIGPLWDAI